MKFVRVSDRVHAVKRRSSVSKSVVGIFAAFFVPLLAVCRTPSAVPADAGIAASEPSVHFASAREFRMAEDTRNASDIQADVFSSADRAKRLAAARALARIADERSVGILLQGLHSADHEILSWSAYGLGFACKNKDPRIAKALQARMITYVPEAPSPTQAEANAQLMAPEQALSRALAHCNHAAPEVALRKLLAVDAWRISAALALGDLAVRQKELESETQLALFDSLTSSVGAGEALYPLSRISVVPSIAEKLSGAVEKSLERASPYRIFAIRTLAKLKRTPAKVFSEIAASNGFSASERVEAAKALAGMGEAGQLEITTLLPKLLPPADAFALGTLGGPLFAVLSTLVQSFEASVPKSSEAALYGVAGLKAPGTPPALLSLRLASLKCSAALALSKGAFETPLLAECDTRGSETWERARLAALVKRPLVHDRQTAWAELLKSPHIRTREAALSAIEGHAELASSARAELAKALEAKEPGLVATAAEVLFKHPERVFILTEKEKRAGLDPKSPPPSSTPEKQVDPLVRKALASALKREFSDDLTETRAALLDAAVALRIDEAEAAAKQAACDSNVTLRTRGEAAMKELGKERVVCAVKAKAADEPQTLEKRVELTFVMTAGEVSLKLEPSLAPATSAHLVALAKSGFYKGIVVHRVVPGFVVQFGDPGGDGYGGSGKSLRCETSPVAFNAGDVGMALAGRDTGSSQMFVTLSRTPHLDGDYAWVGHAEGDWSALIEGDSITDVKVKE
jgi:cyclophilin family peptidyl-prolyl cis-trans isomerase